jgi:hypothetical protein
MEPLGAHYGPLNAPLMGPIMNPLWPPYGPHCIARNHACLNALECSKLWAPAQMGPCAAQDGRKVGPIWAGYGSYMGPINGPIMVPFQEHTLALMGQNMAPWGPIHGHILISNWGQIWPIYNGPMLGVT